MTERCYSRVRAGTGSAALIMLLCLLAIFSAPLRAQERQIAGTVTAADTGEGLALVAVAVAGTAISVGTDAEGAFTLLAPAGEVRLRFTTLGYEMEEIVVPSGQDGVTVVLERDVLNLEGIVATGHATSVSRRNLANAVTSVSAEQLDRAPPAKRLRRCCRDRSRARTSRRIPVLRAAACRSACEARRRSSVNPSLCTSSTGSS